MIIDLAELVAEWIHVLLTTSLGQLLIRLWMLASGGGAVLVCQLWFPNVVSPALLVTAALALVWSVLSPESQAPLGLVLIVVLWWLIGGSQAYWGQQIAVVLLLGAFHLSCAQAALAPSHARLTGTALGRLGLAAALYVVASAAVAVLLISLTRVPESLVPRGGGWVALGVLGLVVAGVVATAWLRGPRVRG